MRIRFGGKLTGNLLEDKQWPTDITPAVVAWALALERGQSDPMVESHPGPKAMKVRFAYKDSLDGKQV